MRFLIAIAFSFVSVSSYAAIPVQKAKVQKPLVSAGNKSGGIAGTGFTLMDLNSKINPKAKVERLMIDVGDLEGKPQKGLPGYFNVELKENAKKVVIDFAQMPLTKIDTKKIKAKLKSSLYVKDVKMLMDPSDNTLSLILDLKKPAKLKVFQVPGKKTTAKVVVDLMS